MRTSAPTPTLRRCCRGGYQPPGVSARYFFCCGARRPRRAHRMTWCMGASGKPRPTKQGSPVVHRRGRPMCRPGCSPAGIPRAHTQVRPYGGWPERKTTPSPHPHPSFAPQMPPSPWEAEGHLGSGVSPHPSGLRPATLPPGEGVGDGRPQAAPTPEHRRRYGVSRRCKWRSGRRAPGGTSNRGTAVPLCLVVLRGLGVGKGGNRNPPFPTGLCLLSASRK